MKLLVIIATCCVVSFPATSSGLDWWLSDRLYIEALTNMKKISRSSSLDILEAINASSTHIYAIVAPIKERTANVDAFLSRMGIPHAQRDRLVTFINAKRFLQNESIQQFIPNGMVSQYYQSSRYRQKVTLGRLGCQLSVVAALSAFLQSKHAVAMLIEDDIIVQAGLSAREARLLLSQMLVIPETQWDIQYLGFCFACNTAMNFHPKSKLFKSNPSSAWLTRGIVQLCRHAMLFTRRSAAIYLQEWKPMTGPGDVRLAEIICETGQNYLNFVSFNLYAHFFFFRSKSYKTRSANL